MIYTADKAIKDAFKSGIVSEAGLEALFEKNKDYVVKDNEIVIVDEFTGRLLPGRRFSGGLHQALEAKENVEVQAESLTLASVTFQNYFRMYEKLSGMTGTAQSSAEEFHKVYKLNVVSIPTNRPLIRREMPDQVYSTLAGRFKAVVRDIKERNIKDIKDKEVEELDNWGKNIQSIKGEIEKIDNDIFSKVE
mgnify:CR=1 FL=1